MPRSFDRPPSAGIPLTIEGNAQWIDVLRTDIEKLVRDIDGLGQRIGRECSELSVRITSNREDIVMILGRDGKSGAFNRLLEAYNSRGERLGKLEGAVVSRHDFDLFEKEMRDEVKKLTVFKAKTTAILVVLASGAGIGGSVIAKLLGG